MRDTNRSEEPVSKFILTVCPPMVTGDKNSASPSCAVAITSALVFLEVVEVSRSGVVGAVSSGTFPLIDKLLG